MKRLKKSYMILVLILILLLASSATVMALQKVNVSNLRSAGSDRYGTSYAVCDDLATLRGEKFSNIVVAYGQNFPDALSGGYLTKVKDAPLLLVKPSEELKVLSYIKKYMKPSGTVYILGGSSVVSNSFEQLVKSSGLSAKRLAGPGRYETNLAILNEIGAETDGLLIARGDNFADSLSASSVGKALMLVDSKRGLTPEQKEYIVKSGIKKFYIIGGTAAVPDAIASTLKSYGTVERVAGASRYGTSIEVAKKFFDNATVITLATGKNFPDGLSGAPLAMHYNSPIVLVSDSDWRFAHQFVVDRKIRKSVAIGGTGAISQSTVDKIMEQYEDTEKLVWVMNPTSEYKEISEMGIEYGWLAGNENRAFWQEYGSCIFNKEGYPQQWYQAYKINDKGEVKGKYDYRVGVFSVCLNTTKSNGLWGVMDFDGNMLYPATIPSREHSIILAPIRGGQFLTTQGIGYSEWDRYNKLYIFNKDFSGIEFTSGIPTGVGIPKQYYIVKGKLFSSKGERTTASTAMHGSLVKVTTEESDYFEGRRIGYAYVENDNSFIEQNGYYLEHYVNGYYVAVEDEAATRNYETQEWSDIVDGNYTSWRSSVCISLRGLVRASTGERITDFIYEDALYFEEGYCPVKKNGKWGLIDTTGEEVTPFIFDQMSSLYKGRVAVIYEGKFGILDIKKTYSL